MPKPDTRMTQNRRVKTDIRLSPELSDVIESVAKSLGVTKGNFFVLAAARSAAELAPLCLSGKARTKVLRVLETDFDSAIADAKLKTK